ncbi:hypothetical protein [Streptomyces lycii]|uniref:hypothetical protein n=1 Tax=Streptomyces lycii TaxID=2654337 RepID=UPI00159D9251|nr:hypothetical protein [Streptomyces lycii]
MRPLAIPVPHRPRPRRDPGDAAGGAPAARTAPVVRTVAGAAVRAPLRAAAALLVVAAASGCMSVGDDTVAPKPQGSAGQRDGGTEPDGGLGGAAGDAAPGARSADGERAGQRNGPDGRAGERDGGKREKDGKPEGRTPAGKTAGGGDGRPGPRPGDDPRPTEPGPGPTRATPDPEPTRPDPRPEPEPEPSTSKPEPDPDPSGGPPSSPEDVSSATSRTESAPLSYPPFV